MFLSSLLIAILCMRGATKGLNDGLPKWIATQNFGAVEFIYRAFNVIAPPFLLYSLTALHFHPLSMIIGALFYGIAYGIKQATRNLAYKDDLQAEKYFNNQN